MRLNNVTVKYGRKVALDHVSLQIHNKNKVIGILGDNGSGKTTLINLVLKNINKFKGQRAVTESIAYMPDRSFLYENMTVKESIKLFEKVFKDFDKNRMLQILDNFSISTNLKLHDCSKGMHEQIHLALIFSRNTDYYILDEPLSAVDPVKRQYFIDIIENYRRKNSSVIIVTHLLRDLGDMLDDVIFLKDGKVISCDSRTELLRDYGDLETAYIKKVGK